MKDKNQYFKSLHLLVKTLEPYLILSGRRISWRTKLKNSRFRGYSACSRCGGNWGWKKWIDHKYANHPSSGCFLFCKECDKKVTVEERYEALNKLNLDNLLQSAFLYLYRYHSGEYNFKEVLSRLKKDLEELETEEFAEWPRPPQ